MLADLIRAQLHTYMYMYIYICLCSSAMPDMTRHDQVHAMVCIFWCLLSMVLVSKRLQQGEEEVSRRMQVLV